MKVNRSVARVIRVSALSGALVLAAPCASGDGPAGGGRVSGGQAGGGHAGPAGAADVHGPGRYSPPPAAPLRAGERSPSTGCRRRAYTPPAPNGGTDEYRCFLVDPGFTREVALTGSQFLPGQRHRASRDLLPGVTGRRGYGPRHRCPVARRRMDVLQRR